mmetsp:Transcript_45670/g.130928  ORF Transcript_45670/g.130928 Transcript_45670/m.130928 type:complete len:99 (+) Transcript_45670:276-572(+)
MVAAFLGRSSLCVAIALLGRGVARAGVIAGSQAPRSLCGPRLFEAAAGGGSCAFAVLVVGEVTDRWLLLDKGLDVPTWAPMRQHGTTSEPHTAGAIVF